MEFLYKVVSAEARNNDELISSLQDMVNISIADGWSPSGGVCVIYRGGEWLYGYQAMTRERDE
ncbi:hypothetical protein [Longimicrobium sp.]|uniref:hypothetical protein n=1 Tax=Longimicrobium sp. TaxID=2029185 RepID=UPI002E34B717|nr:hypothetical protein [Longimicrobium sp.]HEX6037038.1 hypothetical protein [Longimicrobium sp.]